MLCEHLDEHLHDPSISPMYSKWEIEERERAEAQYADWLSLQNYLEEQADDNSLYATCPALPGESEMIL